MKEFQAALRYEIMRAEEGGTRLELVARSLVSRAIEGEIAAIKEIADRIDGKVTQAIDSEITIDAHIRQEVIESPRAIARGIMELLYQAELEAAAVEDAEIEE